MSTGPRVVYAQKSASKQTRVHTPARTVPIIIVPDLLGTRLTEPDSDDLVWNPKGTPFGADPQGFKVDIEALSQMSSTLVPDETHPFDKFSENDALPKIKHVRAMLLDVYKPLAQRLSTELGTVEERLGVQHALYFCGYDWRQDNGRSALRLSEIVDLALEETGESKVVLIGHGMGGMICRYYCKALGGESLVHQLFLVGSPVLGTPAAFGALKHGIEGLYPREIIESAEQGDSGAILYDCAAELQSVIAAFAAPSAGGVADSLIGNLYLLLSLASGKWLSRDEARTFVRQMPSIYQMLPGALFCDAQRHWLLFDPLATGVAPTGFMVPMPTIFAQHMAALDAASGSAHIGRELTNALQSSRADAGTPSARASRNAMPLTEIFARIAELQAAALSDPASLGSDEMAPKLAALIAACMGFFAQAKRTFVDCRNPKSLYEDPYTGLLDAVEERALCGAMLAQAYRFDEALTVSPREVKAESLLDTLKQLVMLPIGFLGRHISHFVHSDASNRRIAGETADETRQKDLEKRLLARKKPKAYIPPGTYAILGDSQETPTGCLIQPQTFVSYDDSNEVRSAYAPIPGGIGDGSVPVSSALPDAALLCRAFAGQRRVSGTRHMELASAADTIGFITDTIDSKIVDFCKG